jgi:hypothetical protein
LTFFPDQGSILLDLGGDSQEGQRKESEMEIFPAAGALFERRLPIITGLFSVTVV